MSIVSETNNRSELEIAIIGMAGKFPGSDDINQFWHNLKEGVESISFFSEAELKESGVSPILLNNPAFVKTKGGILEGKELFDAAFFDYSPTEATILTPQMRFLHECSWEALENAGCEPSTYNGLIGFYAGGSSSLYWEGLVYGTRKHEILGEFATRHLICRDFLATRVAYKLNLKGPALTVQTGCSTSLVAVHLACQAILNGECDMALAGGVTVIVNEGNGYLYQEGMILSPDGHCRAFDAEAKGVIPGSGGGMVVLKLLKDAIANRDYIHAIIKGSAINNDGLRKVGYTAPSIEGQAEVIRTAHLVADVEPNSISYVETHGTGTILGDPVEIEGLKLAFNTNKKRFCKIGSVKTNIGHLDIAAGIAGLIKTVLMLKHKLIPPSINFKTPNPKIDFENSPFSVCSELQEWKNEKYPLRAGVSSFGIGGTNAHVVLEEAKTQDSATQFKSVATSSCRGHRLILLSAKTLSALEKMTKNLASHLRENHNLDLADVAYTLQVGRMAFMHRKICVCSTLEQASNALSSLDSGDLYSFTTTYGNKNIVFMFPGQGAQYVNMGIDLYKTESIFREEIDRCFDILEKAMGCNIKNILYPGISSAHHSNGLNQTEINQTKMAQPLIFIFEYALAKLLMKWGITPHAMIGHSIGEYTAACLSGVFSLEEALSIVVTRGKLMQQMPGGSMLSVSLPESKVKSLLSQDICLAAVNSASLCVVSGTHEAIEIFAKKIKKEGYQYKLLKTSHAFHSFMMDPLLKEFEIKVGQLKFNKPRIPYISNVSGNWITFDDAQNPSYWSNHLRQTVRFGDGLSQLFKNKNTIFVEVGPGRVLSTFVGEHADKGKQHKVLNLIRHPNENVPDDFYLLNKIGHLWLYGKSIHWPGFYGEERRNIIPLPTYPFERQPYWLKGNPFEKELQFTSLEQLNKKTDVADFFYTPLWKQSIFTTGIDNKPLKGIFLVFLDRVGFGIRLVKRLKNEGYEVVTVEKGSEFREIRAGEFTIRAANAADYHALIQELSRLDKIPSFILHLWNITGGDNASVLNIDKFNTAQYLGFYSLIYLSQAAAKENISHYLHFIMLSDNLQDVTGDESISPEKSTALGCIKVIPQEFSNIRCRNIDIILPPSGSKQEEELFQHLLEEISMSSADTIIAYRNNRRWVQTYEAVKLVLDEKSTSKQPLRQGGVYLITGGLGKIGLLFAEFLVEAVGARLILTGRSAFPDKQKWERWLSDHQPSDATGQLIRRIKALEEKGGKVMVFSADTADETKMREVVAQAEKNFGLVNGVLHAAGVTRGHANQCAVEDISEVMVDQQFHSKVHGLLVLAEIFKERKLDFCLLTSSLASILGGLGFAAYSAANIFMDTFVKKYNRCDSSHWVSVNWDGWQLEETKVEGLRELLITPEEGKIAFERILTLWKENQVVVSTGDLHVRLNRWIKMESLAEIKNLHSNEELQSNDRPALTTAYAAPRSELERAISSIWEQFFGFRKIGIEDDFFELGGDSLKIMSVSAKIHRELHVEIPIKAFFNNPTIQKLARYITNTNEKSFFAIEPVEKKEYYPLSSAQKRLYILNEMANINTSYNMPKIFELTGKLDKKSIENAFLELVKRHESLRTSFQMIGGEPVQVIEEDLDFGITIHDTTDGREKEIIENFIRPFNLAVAPLLRVGLIGLSPDSHLLLIDIHHIISDGMSSGIIIREIIDFYMGKKAPELKIQYKDFSAWQNEFFRSNSFIDQENYWAKTLTLHGGIPVLNMPLDFRRPEKQSFNGNTVSFIISSEIAEQLNHLAKEQNVTINILLLSIYSILVGKYADQEDIVIGSMVAGRRHSDLEQIIGMFGNFLPIINHINGEQTFIEFLNVSRKRILDAYENQDYPFERIVDLIHYPVSPSRNPLFDTMVIFHNESILTLISREVEGLKFSQYPLPNKTSKLDFKIDIFPGIMGEFNCYFEYDTELFSIETINKFIFHFNILIKEILKNPGQKISTIELFTAEEYRLLNNKRRRCAVTADFNKSIKLVISGTFVAEPIKDYIRWWGEQFHLKIDVAFTSYNQVFQELLSEESMLSTNSGINLLLVRFEDWIRDSSLADKEKCEKMEQDFIRLTEILKNKKIITPSFIGILPISTHLSLNQEITSFLETLYARWKTFVMEELDNVYEIDFTRLEVMYEISKIFDPITDKEGHIPFSEEYYAAMGTMIARKICALYNQPFKVIVLDCDNTLWRGICGEDGPLNVSIDGPYAELQKFMICKYNEGMLLAICSKNNEADIWEVFEKNPGMLLRKEHFAAWAINWKPKSQNIKELAEELNLGLDSFIFIDDTPLECAEVLMNLPEVLTLQLPGNQQSIPFFLEHVWAFDKIIVTDEDKKRTNLYLAEKKRKKSEKETLSLTDFLSQLELKVSLNIMISSQVKRVSQLTQRTNQFNLSTIRRTEEEITVISECEEMKCWVVEVMDKFGDYGLVGTVITKEINEILFIDTFLISCRVLGREVESTVLAGLKQYCKTRGLKSITADYYPTKKNKPVLDFLHGKWLVQHQENEYTRYSLPVENIPEHPEFVDMYYLVRLENKTKVETTETEDYMLDHIAVAVADIESAKSYYRSLGYHCGETIFDELQNSKLVMCQKSSFDSIELVAAVDSESPTRLLVDLAGDVPYHLCYRVKNISAFLEDLRKKEIPYEITGALKPAKLFNGSNVMFISVKHVGLIELLENKDDNSRMSVEEKIRRTTLRVIIATPGPSLLFYGYLGYTQVKNINKNDSLEITLEKKGHGRIELIVPKKGKELEFLQSHGPHPYQIIFEDTVLKELLPLKEDSISHTWDIKMDINISENLTHISQYLPLEYYTAAKLLSLPTYNVDIEISTTVPYQPPRNRVEERIAGIWQEILKLDKPSISANFLALGGNSIKAILLVSKIHKAFNILLRLGDVFKYPTIRQLGKLIKNSEENASPIVISVEKKEYYALSPAQKRIYIAHQFEIDSKSYNIPSIVQLIGKIDKSSLQDIFYKLIRRHESLRTSFTILYDHPIQQVKENVPFEMDYFEASEDRIADMITQFIQPFDLSCAPLLRIQLVKIGELKHLLMLDMSHIISDGVSLGILIKEFMNLYNAEELPPLNVSYKDFAAWQNNLYESGNITKQEKYWIERFKDELPILALPTDYPRPSVRSVDKGDLIISFLEKQISEKLIDMAYKKNATLFIIMLAVYNILLFKYTGQEDIIVGSSITGRTHADFQNVIGVFVNILGMRNQPRAKKTFQVFLEEVKENALQAFENQDYPMEELVKKLQIQSIPGRHPLFDTEFAMNNIEFEEITIPGLKTKSYESGINFAKFDLHFLVIERNQSLNIRLRYSTELFKKTTAQKIIKHFIEIIGQVIENPGIKLEDIKLTVDLMPMKSNDLEKEQGDFNF